MSTFSRKDIIMRNLAALFLALLISSTLATDTFADLHPSALDAVRNAAPDTRRYLLITTFVSQSVFESIIDYVAYTSCGSQSASFMTISGLQGLQENKAFMKLLALHSQLADPAASLREYDITIISLCSKSDDTRDGEIKATREKAAYQTLADYYVAEELCAPGSSDAVDAGIVEALTKNSRYTVLYDLKLRGAVGTYKDELNKIERECEIKTSRPIVSEEKEL